MLNGEKKAGHFLVNFGGRLTDVCFTITNFITYIFILLNILSIRLFFKGL